MSLLNGQLINPQANVRAVPLFYEDRTSDMLLRASMR